MKIIIELGIDVNKLYERSVNPDEDYETYLKFKELFYASIKKQNSPISLLKKMNCFFNPIFDTTFMRKLNVPFTYHLVLKVWKKLKGMESLTNHFSSTRLSEKSA